jgi:hypothetical protein
MGEFANLLSEAFGDLIEEEPLVGVPDVKKHLVPRF